MGVEGLGLGLRWGFEVDFDVRVLSLDGVDDGGFEVIEGMHVLLMLLIF